MNECAIGTKLEFYSLTDNFEWLQFFVFLLLRLGQTVQFRQNGTGINQKVAQVRNGRSGNVREFLRQFSKTLQTHHQQWHVIHDDFLPQNGIQLLIQATA